MAKITEHGGPSYGPMDAPNARPSEQAYTEAMERHGTPEFTPDDQALVDRYQELRRREAEQDTETAEDPSGHLQGTETGGGQDDPDGDVTGQTTDDGRAVDDMTYAELQQAAKDRNLSSQGSREALVARINEHDRTGQSE